MFFNTECPVEWQFTGQIVGIVVTILSTFQCYLIKTNRKIFFFLLTKSLFVSPQEMCYYSDDGIFLYRLLSFFQEGLKTKEATAQEK